MKKFNMHFALFLRDNRLWCFYNMESIILQYGLVQKVFKKQGGDMNETVADISSDPVKNALLSLAVEGWRFTRAYLRLIAKLDAGDQNRFISRYHFFQKQLEDRLGDVGFRLVNIEGLPFDPGMAAKAINAGDFAPDDKLIVDQMIEPIIMNDDGIVRTGTVLLRKVE